MGKPVILHVVDRFLNRTETFIYNYLTAMDQTDPVVLTKARMNEAEFPFGKIKVIPEQSYPRMSPLWWVEKTIALLTRKGSRKWRIARFAKCLRSSLVHAHFGPIACESLWLKERLKVPFVTTFYGYDMSQLLNSKKWREGYRELFKKGDLFLVEGPHMRQRLIEIGAPEKKTEIQRIAIPVDRYPEWSPDSEAATVLFIGRFVEKKGLIYALEAVRLLRNEIRNLRFRIVGDGPEKERLMKFVADYQMQDMVVFLGTMPHADMLNELQKAHVLIQPSVTAADGDSEGGAPTIILESQAVGTPIVSTKHADIPNVTVEGDGVYLCEEKNVKELADNLRTALQRKKRCGKRFVARYHDVQTEVKLLEEKYLKLIRRNR